MKHDVNLYELGIDADRIASYDITKKSLAELFPNNSDEKLGFSDCEYKVKITKDNLKGNVYSVEDIVEDINDTINCKNINIQKQYGIIPEGKSVFYIFNNTLLWNYGQFGRFKLFFLKLLLGFKVKVTSDNE